MTFQSVHSIVDFIALSKTCSVKFEPILIILSGFFKSVVTSSECSKVCCEVSFFSFIIFSEVSRFKSCIFFFGSLKSFEIVYSYNVVNNCCKPFFRNANQIFVIFFDCKPFVITADCTDETIIGIFTVCSLRQTVDCFTNCSIKIFKGVGESELHIIANCGNIIAYGLSLRTDLRCKVTIIIVSVFTGFKFLNCIVGCVRFIKVCIINTLKRPVAVKLICKILHVLINDSEHLVIFRIEIGAVYKLFHSVDSFNRSFNLSYIFCELSFSIEKGLIVCNPSSFYVFCYVMSYNVSRQIFKFVASVINKIFGNFGILNVTDKFYS